MVREPKGCLKKYAFNGAMSRPESAVQVIVTIVGSGPMKMKQIATEEGCC